MKLAAILRSISLAVVMGLASPPLPAPAAQDALPPAFAGLIGSWRGEGSLMGRNAEFEMSWEVVLGGRFVQLDFSNAFVSEGSEATAPVVASRALYRIGEDGLAAEGTWFDSRGMILPLASVVEPDAVVTEWGDEDTPERGRTTYRVLGPDRLEVVDEVVVDGAYTEFGRAVYLRAP